MLGRLLARGRFALTMASGFSEGFDVRQSAALRLDGRWPVSRAPTVNRRIHETGVLVQSHRKRKFPERDGMNRYARHDRPFVSVHQDDSIKHGNVEDRGSCWTKAPGAGTHRPGISPRGPNIVTRWMGRLLYCRCRVGPDGAGELRAQDEPARARPLPSRPRAHSGRAGRRPAPGPIRSQRSSDRLRRVCRPRPARFFLEGHGSIQDA